MAKGKNVGRRGIVASTLTRREIKELIRIREAIRPLRRRDREVPGFRGEVPSSIYRDPIGDLSFPVERERSF